MFILLLSAKLFLSRQPSTAVMSPQRQTLHEEYAREGLLLARLKRIDLAEELLGAQEPAQHVKRWRAKVQYD